MTRETLAAAAVALRTGGTAVFPTDTVYGLGVSVEAAESPAVLYRLKGRDEGKPISWLVGGPEALSRYGADVPAWAFALAKAFWPGPLTLVVRASTTVPAAFASAAGTIGLRMPASEAALALIRQVGCPLATTSANFSGLPAPGTFNQVDPVLLAKVDAAVPEGDAKAGCGAHGAAAAVSGTSAASALAAAPASGVASTVVDCTGQAPIILREGDITETQIRAACRAVGR